MSHKAVTWAWEQSTGSPTRKAVLVSLADRHNKDTGRCDPSIARIAAETEFSERAVRKALSDLEEMGLIEREERRRADGSRRTYSYRFPHVAADAKQAAPPAGSQAAPPAAEPEVHLEPEVKPLAPAAQNGKIPKAVTDRLWDTLTDIFGPVTVKRNESRRALVVHSLAAAGATPEEMLKRAKTWPLHFDTATLTETALMNHWDRLARKPLRRQ